MATVRQNVLIPILIQPPQASAGASAGANESVVAEDATTTTIAWVSAPQPVQDLFVPAGDVQFPIDDDATTSTVAWAVV